MFNYLLPALAYTSAIQYQQRINYANYAYHVTHPQQRPYSAREILAILFDIKDADLNEPCDKVDQNAEARWKKIRHALTHLHDVKVIQHDNPQEWEKASEVEKYKAQTNVIKTALPCADEAKVAKKLAHYKKEKLIGSSG